MRRILAFATVLTTAWGYEQLIRRRLRDGTAEVDARTRSSLDALERASQAAQIALGRLRDEHSRPQSAWHARSPHTPPAWITGNRPSRGRAPRRWSPPSRPPSAVVSNARACLSRQRPKQSLRQTPQIPQRPALPLTPEARPNAVIVRQVPRNSQGGNRNSDAPIVVIGASLLSVFVSALFFGEQDNPDGINQPRHVAQERQDDAKDEG